MEIGSYQIIKKIATGGMAEIFLARHNSVEGFQRNLVIKRILPEFSQDNDFVQSFLDEARLSAQLNHPNIVQIFDLGKLENSYFIAMEYVRGFELTSLLKYVRKVGEYIPLGVALKIFTDLCSGLDYAHRATDLDGNSLGIVHRDVTPSNVLVSVDGPSKVLDFGIAKATARGDGKTKAGTIKGKFSYLSPEQILGSPIDQRVDVFAAGIVLYELLTNVNPFRADTEYTTLHNIITQDAEPPSHLRADLLPGFDRVIAKALERDQGNRFANIAELHKAVEEVARQEAITLSHHEVKQYLIEHDEVFKAENNALSPRNEGSDSDMEGRVLEIGGTRRSSEYEVIELNEELVEVHGTRFFDRLRQKWLPPVGVMLTAFGVGAFTFTYRHDAPATFIPQQLPTSASLHIVGEPDGAQVMVDGHLLTGTTPIVLNDLEVGEHHQLEVVHVGFRSSKVQVNIEQVGKQEVQYSLSPLPSPSVERPAEPVKLAKTDGALRHVRVAVAGLAGSDTREHAKLRIVVVPWGSIDIDGKHIGDTPLAPRDLEAGAHTIVIENSDLKRRVTKQIRLNPGQEFLLRENLL